jgi:hypothetical protein
VLRFFLRTACEVVVSVVIASPAPVIATFGQAEVAAAVPSVPNACGLLTSADAAQLLGSPASGQTFTALGFPSPANAASDPTYSQCRFTSTTSRSELNLIINALPAKSPSVSEEALAARDRPGYRVLTIDGALTVWTPWTQQGLRGQGGVLSSSRNGEYVAVVLIYVHRDPFKVAERASRMVLAKLSSVVVTRRPVTQGQ